MRFDRKKKKSLMIIPKTNNLDVPILGKRSFGVGIGK
jgi:hypothetical protein